ncbi:MAG: hypothetical protein LC121_23225 [Anaerolineae bacterium]|nr:hypothetical protein [Anaerolineae bacterium]
MGDLYVVPTPIGNLEDITIRALHILRSVSLIAAEDTRHSRKLLTHYDILTRLTSYHEHNKKSKTARCSIFWRPATWQSSPTQARLALRPRL